MKASRLFAFGALLTSFAWLLAGGCSAGNGDDNGKGNPFGGSGGSMGDAQSEGNTVNPDATGNDGGTAGKLNPLCGAGDCLPDNADACRDYEPPTEGAAGNAAAGNASGGAAGEGGQSGGGGQAGDAASGGEGGAGGAGGGLGVGGESGNAGESSGGASGAAGNGGMGGEPSTPSLYSCQVQRQNNESSRHCELAGTGLKNAPCFASADCAAGLGCVTDGEAGRCLAYCCSPDTGCGTPGTYCAERQLRKAGTNTNNAEPARVPVCVPADGCSLDEAYPCQGPECRCTGKTACMLVSDKTTTCIEPGMGQQGEACPCAWNHLCSSVTNQCVKICHTDPTKNECGSQKCQASSELPPNFGVCVGPLL